MANSYFKQLRSKLNVDYKEKFINDLQHDLRRSINSDGCDMYSMATAMNKKSSSLDINVLLKYYVLNQFLEDSKNKDVEENFLDTKHPEIKRDRAGKYYRLKDGYLEEDDSIKSVSDDGTYVIQDKRYNDIYKVLKTCDVEDKIIAIKVVDNSGRPVSNKTVAAEYIGLRKEYKQRYKYSGYSGKSQDVLASLMNFLSTPIETGYYMDFYCMLYKWQQATASFIRLLRDADSPFLVDIEFRDNGTVIKKEYTGVV